MCDFSYQEESPREGNEVRVLTVKCLSITMCQKLVCHRSSKPRLWDVHDYFLSARH